MADYDVVVVGGGHAGCEAASASARMGRKTLLVTMKKENIGVMSCNPAIGGLGKGQLVKEVDALGGLMGRAADSGCIHFKRLNMSKGPAVRASRAQEDRRLYARFMRGAVKNTRNLKISEGEVEEIELKGNTVNGVKLNCGENINCRAVIISSGTFLNGLMYKGLEGKPGGRVGERQASSLSEWMKRAGFEIMRLQTGTCARLKGKTIDFSKLKKQFPDENIRPFSFITEKIKNPQLPCPITYTNEKTCEIVRRALDRSFIYASRSEGKGPRYCPLIEDKVHRFSEVSKHRVVLEPEGLDTELYYPNGLFTAMPENIQIEFLRSIKGLQDVEVARFGYGIEYDAIDPRQLFPTLESKKIKKLYFAGQVNGTTGYEEAAAQGIIAGINAAASLKGMSEFVLKRDEAYAGVLIDDLVTKGTNEPYRMFTSRAEYRLILREDNAHLRLTEAGYKYGSLGKLQYDKLKDFKSRLESARESLTASAKDILKRPGKTFKDIKNYSEKFDNLDSEVMEELEIEIKYEGYIKRQEKTIRKMKEMEKRKLKNIEDYSKIEVLSAEESEKLNRIRPRTLGQASRIPGITPAAVTGMMIYMKKLGRKKDENE